MGRGRENGTGKKRTPTSAERSSEPLAHEKSGFVRSGGARRRDAARGVAGSVAAGRKRRVLGHPPGDGNETRGAVTPPAEDRSGGATAQTREEADAHQAGAEQQGGGAALRDGEERVARGLERA